MSQNNRGFKGKNAISNNRRSHTDLPENIGNKKTFEEMRIPPDDVGNIVDHDPIATFTHDGLGNSLDNDPAHLKSGILAHLMGRKERSFSRRPVAEQQIKENVYARSSRSCSTKTHLVKKEDVNNDNSSLREPNIDRFENGDDYMASLVKEFAKLLSERSGLPFSFSMKPVNDNSIDETRERQNLIAIKLLIEEILRATFISASVSFLQYRSANHRFGVFFINPKERDPAKNKELISALRQVVKLHAAKFSPGQVNVLLVLANAQSVIEGHLYKIGAKKVEL
jgi:hypothetical protein